MARLTYARRKALSDRAFAEPEERKYPIPDESHARNALARASGNASPAEQAKIKAKVKAKFPGIKVSK